MNLFKMLFGSRVKSSDTVVRLNLSEPEPWYGADRAPPSMPSTEAGVLGLSAAWACVNLHAGIVGSLPCMVYRTDSNGNRVEARDHPLYRLLHDSPNYDQTALEFWEAGQAALELRGNMYARKVFSGPRLVSLEPFYNPTVTREQDGSRRYRWTSNGRSYDEPQENVFHVRSFCGGLSTLSYGRQVFGLAQSANAAADGTFRNGIRPAGVLSMDKFMSPDQRDQLEERLQEKYQGAMNAGRPMVLEGGLKWSAITINPEDAQMLESRSFSIEEVCRMYEVPPFLIGHTDKASGYPASLDQQLLLFQKFALRKRLARIEQAAKKQLLTPADIAAGVVVEYNIEGFLRGDPKGRSEFYKSALDGKYMVINEVRRLENQPPVPWGDRPWVQMQDVQLGADGSVPKLPSPPAPGAPQETIQ